MSQNISLLQSAYRFANKLYAIFSFDSNGNPVGFNTPSGGVFGQPAIPFNLPKFNYALAQMKAGVRNARILFIGDSTTAGLFANGLIYNGNRALNFPTTIANNIAGRTPAYYGNTIGDTAFNTANFLLYDPRWQFPSSGWSSNFSSIANMGGGAIGSNTSGAIALFTPTQPFDTVDVYYYQISGYGTLALNVDGGPTLGAVINTAGTASIKKATRTCALGNHTLNLVKSADTNNVIIVGISTYKSTATGIEFLSAGAGGQSSSFFAASTNVWDSSYTTSNLGTLAAIAPDLVVFSPGINDWGSGVTPATYATNIQAVITAAQLYADVLLVTATPTASSSTAIATQLGIVQQTRLTAAEDGLPLVDTYNAFASYSFAQSILGYFTSDLIHPNVTGYNRQAQLIQQALGL